MEHEKGSVRGEWGSFPPTHELEQSTCSGSTQDKCPAGGAQQPAAFFSSVVRYVTCCACLPHVQIYRTMVALQTVDTIFYEAQRQASTHVYLGVGGNGVVL